MSDNRELPSIIVAIDGHNTLRYVHINEITEETRNDYYICPICGEKLHPRSINEDNLMQRHFYHEKGDGKKCSESYAHWLYKEWLFKNDSKFIINDDVYTVESVEVEKTYDTKIGKYIPDLTVHTSDDKTILFEMNFTNEKKSKDYLMKWKELDYDVVEVDVKGLVESSINKENVIPKFKLIYSDGVCYKKDYQSKDRYYNDVGKRIDELKRKDILNYKSRCEKLDWLWYDLYNFKKGTISFEELIISYENLELEDMEFCIGFLGGHLKEYKQQLKDLYNDKFMEVTNKYFEEYEQNNEWISKIRYLPKLKYGLTITFFFNIGKYDYIRNLVCLNNYPLSSKPLCYKNKKNIDSIDDFNKIKIELLELKPIYERKINILERLCSEEFKDAFPLIFKNEELDTGLTRRLSKRIIIDINNNFDMNDVYVQYENNIEESLYNVEEKIKINKSKKYLSSSFTDDFGNSCKITIILRGYNSYGLDVVYNTDNISNIYYYTISLDKELVSNNFEQIYVPNIKYKICCNPKLLMYELYCKTQECCTKSFKTFKENIINKRMYNINIKESNKRKENILKNIINKSNNTWNFEIVTLDGGIIALNIILNYKDRDTTKSYSDYCFDDDTVDENIFNTYNKTLTMKLEEMLMKLSVLCENKGQRLLSIIKEEEI